MGRQRLAIAAARGQVVLRGHLPERADPAGEGLLVGDRVEPRTLLLPNALNCYALGPKNKTLKYNDDGSLTIYLGNQSPGKEKESNWLPAPDGNFLSGFGPIGPTRPSSTALGSQVIKVVK